MLNKRHQRTPRFGEPLNGGSRKSILAFVKSVTLHVREAVYEAVMEVLIGLQPGLGEDV